MKQENHIDFHQKLDLNAGELPYSILIALGPDVSIYIGIHQVHKIELERLSALIMRGDCVHAGAEYLHRDQLNNLRFHAYVTTAIYSPREDNELVTLFRKTRKETNAEKKKRDFSLVMKCH